MSIKYAKDQPEGFVNRIERVVIVGASGHVGSHVAKALLATDKHTVTALTRKGGSSRVPYGVKAIEVDYDSHESLVQALKGQQFLVIAISPQSGPNVQENLLRAAAEAGCEWVMPNHYSIDVANEELEKDLASFPKMTSGMQALTYGGPEASRVIVVSSLWYGYCLAKGPALFGLDVENRRITFFDDGNARINLSSLPQVGRAVAGFLSLPMLPEDENDTAVTMSHWRNKPLYISSYQASQREILDSVHRIQGTTDEDWQIEYESSAERVKKGIDLMSEHDFTGLAYLLGGRTFYPDGSGNYEATKGLANDVLGLTKEDLDEATKLALILSDDEDPWLAN